MSYFDKCAEQYGTVYFEGVTYALEEQAYVTNVGTDGKTAYDAIGFSRNQLAEVSDGCDFDPLFNSHALVRWAISESWLESDDFDESNACDWDKPEFVFIR